jgi:hypothetical protein
MLGQDSKPAQCEERRINQVFPGDYVVHKTKIQVMAEAAQDAGDVSIFVEFNAPWSRFGIIATRRTRSRVAN